MKMSLPEFVAALRFKWHANMVDVVNVANQLHLISDDKAEQLNKRHAMTIITDILPRIEKENLQKLVDAMMKGES